MKTITVNAGDLADLIINSVDEAGSTDWAIMVDVEDGTVDLRHNTHDNSGYVELCSMYNGIDREWLGMDDDDYSEDEAKDFLISDTIPEWLSREFEHPSGETYSIELEG